MKKRLSNRQKAVVTRMAPAWAWAIIDDTLSRALNRTDHYGEVERHNDIAAAQASVVVVAREPYLLVDRIKR